MHKDVFNIKSMGWFNGRHVSFKVRGMLVLSQNIIVSDCFNVKLKLFDLYIVHVSSVASKHSVWGITAIGPKT